MAIGFVDLGGLDEGPRSIDLFDCFLFSSFFFFHIVLFLSCSVFYALWCGLIPLVEGVDE